MEALVIYQLISRPSLIVSSDDRLWHFVSNVREDSHFPFLLEWVRFEYLTIESMSEFDGIADSAIQVVTRKLWEAIARRLALPALPTLFDDWFLSSHHPLCEFRPFSGIISFLTRKHRGNVVDRQIVKMSAKSRHTEATFPLKNVVDLDTSAPFWTEDQSGQWICWDFQKSRMIPPHSAIHSDCSTGNLRTWALGGSSDRSSTVVIDEGRDDLMPQRRPIAAAFKIANPVEVSLLRVF
jgi:hypothetical protein